jgi:hypothetical protein
VFISTFFLQNQIGKILHFIIEIILKMKLINLPVLLAFFVQSLRLLPFSCASLSIYSVLESHAFEDSSWASPLIAQAFWLDIFSIGKFFEFPI